MKITKNSGPHLHFYLTALTPHYFQARMKVKKPGMSDEHHDYSEIYTPTREVSGLAWAGPGDRPESMSGSSSVRTGSGDSGVSGGSHCINQGVAPPPPIHKYPSWEDRIYQVASHGLSQTSDVVLGAQIDSRNNNSLPSHQHLAPGGYGADINVPVYATVKGVSRN